MKSLLFIALLSLSLCIQKPPVITIYSESLCPDCVDFEVNQFSKLLNHPSRELLFEKFNYIWFGNARELPDSTFGNRKFVCQHGANECLGNFYYNCAQINLLLRDDLDDYFACAAKKVLEDFHNADFDKITTKCTSTFNYSLIKACVASGMGAELHSNAGNITGNHPYVPYFLVDGKNKKEWDDALASDAVRFLCDYVHLTGQVEGC